MIESISNFLVGSVSGMAATCVIQPIDMIKVRIQIAGESGGDRNPLSIARNLLKNDGVMGFYKGIDAALSRQLVYGGLRLGLFKSFSDQTSNTQQNGGQNPIYIKLMNSTMAGGLGAFIANPVDLSLVRLQGDSIAPIEKRKGQKNVVDTLRRIASEEGVLGLWKGSTPTVARAVVFNMAQLTTNDQIRDSMKNAGVTNWQVINVTAATVAGVVVACTSLPFDNCKTRLQNMLPDAEGKYPYKGLVDVFAKVLKDRPMSLYDGLGVFILRVVPHSFIALVLNSYINDVRAAKKK